MSYRKQGMEEASDISWSRFCTEKPLGTTNVPTSIHGQRKPSNYISDSAQ